MTDWSNPSTPPGEWSVSADRGYNSRNFWVVQRYNGAWMGGVEYLCTTVMGRKRFYIESKAIAAAAKLNAETKPKGNP